MTSAFPGQGLDATAAASRWSDVRGAARDTVSVGFGLFPLGMAFGLLLVTSGFDWWWAPIFSMMIYAGSLEFLAIGLVLAVTPLASVAMTTLLVNFRHVFYALSFPLHRVRGKVGRIYSMYALIDEAYAVAASRPPESLSGRRVLLIQVLCQLYWVLGGVTGALVGRFFPMQLTGLDFALTALFAVLAVDAFRVRRDVPGPVLALLSALVALVIARDQMLAVAMSLFVVALLVRYLWRRRRRPADA
ncbi:AzlC family ABC transporter permease [Rhodococcus spongiicola]|uniref:Branched-chain amino acid ABC transporter permease n=1 Tax=Rhodococcus spongiicola TaxID=2487352 RepID=A0A3S3B3U3_9NOCA|nr:AzlC family ABC transporter permease [Rhodococcus spongiicola]RVW02482.1 branched-chain amino acid ABC transporter permease [Rhodococcus spongiicola]